MRALALALSVGLLTTATALAQIQQFPYEANVQANDVYVRSGPGQRYYPTGKLKLGDRVVVHRHDPGGWFMIAPPAGSFSWIDASLVRKAGPNRGVIEVPPLGTGQTARAIVRIGSEFSDDHTIYSRELLTGDEVAILGEKHLPTDRGSVLMYKISPPPLEYRWVKGDFIRPASAETRRQAERDPFATPFAQRDPTSPGTATPVARGAEIGDRDAVDRELQRAQRSTAARRAHSGQDADSGDTRLSDLDNQYAVMIGQDPATWRLDDLEREYRALQASADARTNRAVEQRLAAIAARKRIQAEYQDFLRLTTQTTQRDAQLLTLQNGGLLPTPVSAPPVQLGTPEPVTDGGPSLPGAPPAAPPPAPPGTPTVPSIPEQPLPAEKGDAVTPRFDGAGLIHRSGNMFPGMPAHVLVSPDGRILAYLEAVQGINLDQYLGQSLGLTGQRTHDPRLGADRIVVRRLAPVQLKP
jgi:hypothetical protein